MEWAEHEESVLKSLRREGVGYEAIGKVLGRSRYSVKGKAVKLGCAQRRFKEYESRGPIEGSDSTRKFRSMLVCAEAEWARLMEGRSFANIR